MFQRFIFPLREARQETGRRIAMSVHGNTAPFDILNISPNGIAGRCALRLDVGQYASFQFENGEQCIGQVRWAREDKVGVYFARALSASIMLGGDQRRALAQRPPRYAAARRATIKVAMLQRQATIRNISSGGMMIETTMPLNIQQVLTLLCGEASIVASVRWTSANLAGIKANKPIDLALFEELSQRRSVGTLIGLSDASSF